MARIYTLNPGNINLLAAAGAGLRVEQWYPKSGTPIYGGIPPYIVESIDVLADRGADDDLAATLQALDHMRWMADMFKRDPIAENAAWLHAKMDGETGERRAFVRSIVEEWRSNQLDQVGEAAAHDAKLKLQIERHPYWESTSSETLGTPVNKSGAAVRWDYSGPVKGDVEGRWEMCEWSSDDLLIDRIWLGLRSKTKHSDATDFPNLWECEAATTTAGTDCSAPTTDADASPGGAGNTKRVVNFATQPDWAKRLTLSYTMVDVEAIALALWLFRCKIDAGTTCEVQLRWGWSGMADDYFSQGQKVQVSSSEYDYAEMGISQIPPGLIHSEKFVAVLAGTGDYWIQLWAKRVSGSGSLHLDCLCPIPLDEGYLIVKQIGGMGYSSKRLQYYQSPDDKDIAVVGQETGEIYKIPEWSAWNFRPPPSPYTSNAFSIYGVFARESSADLTDAVTDEVVEYYPRWLNLRGAS